MLRFFNDSFLIIHEMGSGVIVKTVKHHSPITNNKDSLKKLIRISFLISFTELESTLETQ